MAKNKIFVYGTLKSGFSNHSFLSGSEFIGEFRTSLSYSLIKDMLPYLIKQKSDIGVLGEVYCVDDQTLNRLDSLEGHPDWYKRELIELIGIEGVSSYVLPSFEIPREARKILDGVYKRDSFSL